MTMGFFDRLGTGWRLGKQSLRVVWNDKTLLLFPILSGITALVAFAGICMGIGPEQLALLAEVSENPEIANEISPVAYAIAILGYFVLAFITVFFNVALVGCVHISMEDRDSKLVDGLRVAFAHFGSILAWALVSGTVGLLLSGLDKDKRSGSIVRSVLGAAWTVITYFVIPVMVFERTNVFSAIGRSTKIMAKTWGENIGAQFGLGWIFFLLTLPVFGLVVLAFLGGGALLVPIVAIGVVYVAFTAILCQTAKSVLTVVLYKYATSGQTPAGFEGEMLQHVFAPQAGRSAL